MMSRMGESKSDEGGIRDSLMGRAEVRRGREGLLFYSEIHFIFDNGPLKPNYHLEHFDCLCQ